MKLIICFFILFLVGRIEGRAETSYTTSIINSKIKNLQVKRVGEFVSNPVISLNDEKQLEVNFDVLGDGYSRYAYSVEHCNADWTPSGLLPIEYVSGFQRTTIEDYANSMATTVAYTNYRFFLPNEEVHFKLSGNYVVKLYDEDEPDKELFTACFYVTESLITINANISGKTDIDVNQHHQQLEFSIDHRNFPIPHPLTDLKIYVYQNARRDNNVTNLTPSSILQNQLVYSHSRELIFEAGNEYRRAEFLSNQYNGMHVEQIQFYNPYYHLTLFADQKRNHLAYQYDQDQNGRFFTRCSSCSDPDTEADYYVVHFTLDEDEIRGGNVYLNGLLVHNNFTEESRMEYNREAQRYEKSLLLKAGSYNYQYLFVPEGESKGQAFPIEGDFAETENEYTIAVYHRPIGARYDRLIGFEIIQNRMTVF